METLDGRPEIEFGSGDEMRAAVETFSSIQFKGEDELFIYDTGDNFLNGKGCVLIYSPLSGWVSSISLEKFIGMLVPR